MATIDINQKAASSGKATYLWETVTGSDVGEALEVNGHAGLAMAVQMTGTFGAAVTMQGSIDGSTWASLKDTQGNDAALSATGIIELSTAVKFIRPSAAASVSDVDVYLCIRRG